MLFLQGKKNKLKKTYKHQSRLHFLEQVNNAMLIVGDDTNCDILFSVFLLF